MRTTIQTRRTNLELWSESYRVRRTDEFPSDRGDWGEVLDRSLRERRPARNHALRVLEPRNADYELKLVASHQQFSSCNEIRTDEMPDLEL